MGRLENDTRRARGLRGSSNAHAAKTGSYVRVLKAGMMERGGDRVEKESAKIFWSPSAHFRQNSLRTSPSTPPLTRGHPRALTHTHICPAIVACGRRTRKGEPGPLTFPLDTSTFSRSTLSTSSRARKMGDETEYVYSDDEYAYESGPGSPERKAASTTSPVGRCVQHARACVLPRTFVVPANVSLRRVRARARALLTHSPRPYAFPSTPYVSPCAARRTPARAAAAARRPCPGRPRPRRPRASRPGAGTTAA